MTVVVMVVIMVGFVYFKVPLDLYRSLHESHVKSGGFAKI